MNRHLPLMSAILLGTLFLTVSCDKESEAPKPTPTEEYQAISDPNSFLSTSEVAEINFAGIIYSFEHGNNMIENVEESFSFEEEEEGIPFTTDLVSNYDLIYTDNRLSAIDVETEVTISVTMDGETEVVANESESYSIAVEYNSNKLLTSLTETHTEGDYVLKMEREYNSDNKLIKETQLEDGEEIQRRTFEWSGFNVSSEDIFTQDAGSNERKIRARAALRKKLALATGNENSIQARVMADENSYADFDDKINPLNVLSLFGFSNGLFISNNNPGRVNSLDGESEESVEIEHTYDNQGRPIQYSVTDPEEGPITIDVEYHN